MSTNERLYGAKDFDELCEQSIRNVRLRQHSNIHTDYSDPCQRLFIAIQPRSYVAPHRHTSPSKSETFIVLRGRIGLLFFDSTGQIERTAILGPECESQVCDIAPGVWHTALALRSNSVFMEVKPGPFCPIEPIDLAPWAPAYGATDVGSYLDSLYSHFDQ